MRRRCCLVSGRWKGRVWRRGREWKGLGWEEAMRGEEDEKGGEVRIDL